MQTKTQQTQTFYVRDMATQLDARDATTPLDVLDAARPLDALDAARPRDAQNAARPRDAPPRRSVSVQSNLCSDYIFDPQTRRTIHLNPALRSRRRKEEFDAVRFLMGKKTNQEYHAIEFSPEEDVQEEVALMHATPDQKRLRLIAEGVLRRIAEHLENLGRLYTYRLLDVHYEQ